MTFIDQARFIRATPLCHVSEPELLRIIDGLLAEIERITESQPRFDYAKAVAYADAMGLPTILCPEHDPVPA